MSWFGNFLNSEAGSSTISSLVGLGTGLIINNQVKQDAKTEANNAQALADKQIQAQQLAYQTAQLQLQAQQKGGGEKSNTGLYVGLGVGGALILGLVVFLAVKK